MDTIVMMRLKVLMIAMTMTRMIIMMMMTLIKLQTMSRLVVVDSDAGPQTLPVLLLFLVLVLS